MSNSQGRSPLFEAQNALRYERQEIIRNYQSTYDCRLVVMSDVIFSRSINLLEEMLYDARPEEDLHVLLYTLGGDGETALRLIRQAQSRCKELTVIVPDQAKSAGTLFALGADQIGLGASRGGGQPHRSSVANGLAPLGQVCRARCRVCVRGANGLTRARARALRCARIWRPL